MKIVLTYTLPLFILIAGSTSISAQDLRASGDRYKVVINHEEQYSLIPIQMTPPKGWKETSVTGSRKYCQQYIEEVWTDMRPLSVRQMDLPADVRYQVVINHEEQYAILPIKINPPEGWKVTGKSGSLRECTRYIQSVWTDMRPLSLRKQ